ncbi:MAG TPA: phosphatase PAP2 family protein [Planctomycetaceae bacterium]|nr:phosphatase PAP2 family protein [Planctomycetaceae bacterium]
MPTAALPERSLRLRRLILAVVPPALFVLGLAALAVDVPVARFCDERQYPRFITDMFNNTEPFGHAAGVVLIAATVAVLDPQRRRWAASLCLCGALGGGLAANVVKLAVGRTRPRNFDFALTGVADTFTSLFPFGAGGSAAQSFPSAHTATATGLAVALTALYPHGRWWFVTLAGLVALHRVESSAHYPSDVCAGAMVGWLIGTLCIAITARMYPARTELTVAAPELSQAA